MRQKKQRVLILLLFTLLYGCTSVGTLMNVPQWFTRISPSENILYFTGFGEDKDINESKAKAAESIADLVLSEMGLPIYTEMPEEGKNSYEEFKDAIIASLVIESSIVDGFSLENSYVQTESENYCWMLASYNKADFESMRRSFSIYFPIDQYYESEEANISAESLDSGDIYSAILNGFKSVQEAFESGNNVAAGFYLIELLESYENYLGSLTPYAVTLPDDKMATGLGSALIQLQMPGSGENYNNAIFDVNFFAEKPDGSLVEKEIQLSADNSGLLTFYAPVFNNPGNQYISFKINSEPFKEALGKVPQHLTDRTERFFNYLDTVQLHYGFSVVNDYRLIPTAVVVLDKDITGNVLSPPTTEVGLLDVLISDGANVEILPLSPEELFKYNELELIRMLETVYGDKYRRVIWGSGQLDRFSPEGDFYSVTAEANIVVTDLITHQTLYSFSLTKNAQAVQSDVAISTAFRELGRAWAIQFIEDQP